MCVCIITIYGMYEPGNPQPCPQMNQLKRIQVSNRNTTPIKAISFMLPYGSLKSNIKYVTPLAGAIVGSYSNSFMPSIDLSLHNSKKEHFHTISKAWRASFSTMHADTAKFVRESQLATSKEIGLSKIMKVIKNLQVMPTIKVMLHKTIK